MSYIGVLEKGMIKIEDLKATDKPTRIEITLFDNVKSTIVLTECKKSMKIVLFAYTLIVMSYVKKKYIDTHIYTLWDKIMNAPLA